MHMRRAIWIAVLLSLGITAACGSAPASTPTPAPTATKAAPTPTVRPSPTPQPTATPDAAATARAEDFSSLRKAFEEKGFLEAGGGDVYELEPFKEEWPQINWYQWMIYDEIDRDFLFSGHFRWSTASQTPEESGCGIAFGIQPNDNHYAVFLGQTRILFMMGRGQYSYEVGKTSGSGKVKFENPAEADFALAVVGDKAYVSVDGEFTTYTLSKDQSPHGEFGYSVLSGTNRDYGTRCEISDAVLWVAD